MDKPSRIDWTGEREKKAKRFRLVTALCLATLIIVTLGAIYLSRTSQPVASQPASYSGFFGGAQMYEVAAHKESRREESSGASTRRKSAMGTFRQMAE